jgi:hypothetical protein
LEWHRGYASSFRQCLYKWTGSGLWFDKSQFTTGDPCQSLTTVCAYSSRCQHDPNSVQGISHANPSLSLTPLKAGLSSMLVIKPRGMFSLSQSDTLHRIHVSTSTINIAYCYNVSTILSHTVFNPVASDNSAAYTFAVSNRFTALPARPISRRQRCQNLIWYYACLRVGR